MKQQISVKLCNLHRMRNLLMGVGLFFVGQAANAQVMQPLGGGLGSRVVASFATQTEYFALVEDVSTPVLNDYTLARWNGIYWKYYPGLETPAPVISTDGRYNFHSVAYYNNTMYVAAYISNASKDAEVPISHLYKYDETTHKWVAEIGVVDTKNDGIIAMTVFDNKLIVAGRFTNTVNSKAVQSIASFDGTNWDYLGSSNTVQGVDGTIRSLMVQGNRLYIAGDFQTFAGTLTGNIAYYTAANGGWGGVGSPFLGEVTELATFDNQLAALGTDSFGRRVVRVFKSGWSPAISFDSFDMVNLTTIAGTPNYLLIGGDFSKNGNTSSILRYENNQLYFTGNRLTGPYTLGQRGNGAFVWGNFVEQTTGVKFFSPLEVADGNLSGDLFYDKNSNCIKESDEYGIRNSMLRIVKKDNNQVFFAITNENGHFSAALPEGDYMIYHVAERHMYSVCGGNYATNIRAGKYSFVSLGEYMDPLLKDVEITLKEAYVPEVKAGETVKVIMHMVNHGASSITGPTVHVAHAARIAGFSSTPSPDNYDVNNGEATYTLVDFKPFEERWVEMMFTLPSDMTTSDKFMVQVKTGSLFTKGDAITSDNYDTTQLTVGKRSNYDGTIVKTSSMGDTIDYRKTSWSYAVNFKNTTGKTVSKAVFIDTLSDKLPLQRVLLTSFYPLKATPYIQQGRILVVHFDPAGLTPIEVNPTAACGWVEYQVDLYDKLAVNTQVPNRAFIDFDGLSKTGSNTCLVHMVDPTAGVNSWTSSKPKLSIYPNPVRQQLKVTWLPKEIGNRFEIISMLGAEMVNGKVGVESIDVTALPAGVYLLKTPGTATPFVVQ